MIQKRKIALEALKPMWILITALLDLKDKSGFKNFTTKKPSKVFQKLILW